MLTSKYALFKNQRTGKENRITIQDNKIIINNDRLSHRIYLSVQEYFSDTESLIKDFSHFESKCSKQYCFELNQVKNKYPEYFI